MKKTELIMTKAWQTNAPWLKVFKPLSMLYQVISDHRRNQYLQGKRPIYRAPVPVVVIGNIPVGGSGKTPLIITLVTYLMSKGVRVGVISRGYGGDTKTMPRMVTKDSIPSQVGDEPCLIVQSVANEQNIPMAVAPKRGQAIDLLIKTHPDIQLIISDDGLQHYALHRDVEWIVVDADRGFGSGELLPTGFLREPVSRLEGAVVIYHYGKAEDAKNSTHQHTMYLAPSPLQALVATAKQAPSRGAVYGLSGIGYPKRFFKTLSALGFDVIECPMPDHHSFVLADIERLQEMPIITTSKDAVKLRTLIHKDTAHLFDNIWVLPVTAMVSEGVYGLADTLITMLQNIAHNKKDKS